MEPITIHKILYILECSSIILALIFGFIALAVEVFSEESGDRPFKLIFIGAAILFVGLVLVAIDCGFKFYVDKFGW